MVYDGSLYLTLNLVLVITVGGIAWSQYELAIPIAIIEIIIIALFQLLCPHCTQQSIKNEE